MHEYHKTAMKQPAACAAFYFISWGLQLRRGVTGKSPSAGHLFWGRIKLVTVG